METSTFLDSLLEMVDLIINPSKHSGDAREELINNLLFLKSMWEDAEADYLKLCVKVNKYESRYGNIEE